MIDFDSFIRHSLLIILTTTVSATCLKVYNSDCPQVFFFRQAEGMAANQNISYKKWEANFDRLMGIMGKALEEEVPGRSIRNPVFFTRFKNSHPDQAVLLHINGNARDPRYESGRFFAGHWIYYNGAKIIKDVPAESGKTVIHVSNASLFHTQMGRYKNCNEDIGLCTLDKSGKPDWHNSEQVQLISTDTKKNTITVLRGCYGTSPIAFKAQNSYAAAHVTEGPWGKKSNLLWVYNYSTACPKDTKGRTCSDIFAEHISELFGPSGQLNAFDGLEFDVLHNHCGRVGKRGADCDADGVADAGIIDGFNSYGAGVVEFCRKLRKQMSDDFILLADGHSAYGQRAFGILNGIESEGWPDLRDHDITDWSGGLNRHFFWEANGRTPVFNYINHKFTMAGENPGQRITPDLPFSIHRLVFAAAVFTDSAICCSFVPKNDPDGLMGIWDEFRMGTENRLGWLGRPLGPAVRLAESAPDILNTDKMIQSHGNRSITIKSNNPSSKEIQFQFTDVPCSGPDLFVSITAKADPMKGYPKEMARLMHVGIASDKRIFVNSQIPESGIKLRNCTETQLDPQTGAGVRFIGNLNIQDQSHDAYFVHPPYQDGKRGYTYWQRSLAVGKEDCLDFYIAMGPKSPEKSDGVDFIIQAAEVKAGKVQKFKEIFKHNQKAHQWTHHTVSLDNWNGKEVMFKFISDCGPDNNSTTDHSYWGDVCVLGPEGRNAITPPQRFMTWVNDRDFTSHFYFSDIRSKKIDLRITIESTETISISHISARYSPDVTYRKFENGVVLANPSPREYTFDMKKLFANERYHRLQATANQDTTTNNGKLIRDKLTLGPKEGLFLVKVK